ncbi:axonemal dynein light chain domain-containing protein 1 isoform X2 [Pleurodeles waltl]
MSVHEVPVPPGVPKPEGRSMKGSLSLMTIGEENAVLPSLKKSSALDRSQPLPTSLQSDFIPEEILSVLTSTANAAPHPEFLGPPKKNKSLKDMKVGVRHPDQLWHHPGRRGRFKHLTEQPVCLTGAGRDISFLCDALTVTERSSGDSTCAGTQRDGECGTVLSSRDSLIPQEFHIVKNKGVLGLEYYEDKYTTLLEDPEKRLMVFPSMKPNSRAEVLQLMKVMDTMLEKAGVDAEGLGESGPTQMHNLLELLKAEQNIYNIVFHELIRQVSVECVERGELLSRIRQRYVNLLDRIPRQVQSLYNDMLAQRAVDRRLTEEVVHFKNAIGDLISELSQVREHDLRVSKEANYAREQLALSLEESRRNVNMLEEYRELYELQRQRLETRLAQLTEERDLWSSATYRLAQKVIEENRLHLAQRLYISEKAWTKAMRHFTVFIASKDTQDLSQIEQVTEHWREVMVRFGEEAERAEESSMEKLLLLRGDLEKWHKHFKENVFGNEGFQGVPSSVMENVLQDLKSWEKMMSEDLDRFGGDVLLSNQERLKLARSIQLQWTQLGQEVLQRHCSLDDELPPEHKVMEDLNRCVQDLCIQYTCRVEGENGVAKSLTSFVSSLEAWTFQLQAIRDGPHGLSESEWQRFHYVLPNWMDKVDRTLKLIGTTLSEEQIQQGTSCEQVVPADVFKMLQHWNLAMTSGAEKDDLHLTQEVTSLHTAMVRWMVNLLIFLVPNYPSHDTSVPLTATEFPEEDMATHGASVEELVKDACSLSQKLKRFSSYIVRSCMEMVDKISQDKGDSFNADPTYELKELEIVKMECNEWIETCQLLLSELTGLPVSLMATEHQESIEELSVKSKPKQPASHRFKDTEPSGVPPMEVSTEGKAKPVSSFLQTFHDPLPQDPFRDQPETTDTMNIIGHDANIKKKSLEGEEVLVSIEGLMTAAMPQTPKSQLAFEALATLEQLHEQLLQTELRAQKAEETAESLDEKLRNALERIQELERQTPAESKTVVPKVTSEEKPFIEDSDRGEDVSNQLLSPPRQRKRIKSGGKSKH